MNSCSCTLHATCQHFLQVSSQSCTFPYGTDLSASWSPPVHHVIMSYCDTFGRVSWHTWAINCLLFTYSLYLLPEASVTKWIIVLQLSMQGYVPLPWQDQPIMVKIENDPKFVRTTLTHPFLHDCHDGNFSFAEEEFLVQCWDTWMDGGPIKTLIDILTTSG